MKTIVLKLGGAVCLRPETLDALTKGLHAMLESGYSPVLVHGGGPQLDKAIQGLGEATVKHKGLRYTSKAAAAVVARELDAIGAELTAALQEKGVPAVHFGTGLRLVKAAPKRLADGFDLGRVGDFKSIDLSLIRQATATAPGVLPCIPVITPVGFDHEGPLNVNADEAGAGIAGAIGASRLFLATDVPHVRDADGAAVHAIDEVGAASLILDGAAQGGMIPKLMAALAALEVGVDGVLVTAPEPEAFLACVADEPAVGTWIKATRKAHVRVLEDTVQVVPVGA